MKTVSTADIKFPETTITSYLDVTAAFNQLQRQYIDSLSRLQEKLKRATDMTEKLVEDMRKITKEKS